MISFISLFFFFFNDTATTEIYTLSLHDSLPISRSPHWNGGPSAARPLAELGSSPSRRTPQRERAEKEQQQGHERSEEHTSELQSQSNLVCRLLLEKKK